VQWWSHFGGGGGGGGSVQLSWVVQRCWVSCVCGGGGGGTRRVRLNIGI